ncbi:type II secretion system F family protein [Corynebacterium sp.]|uniref:type II secretion system F family protein n=1 Tax=Corynebacterium sp. TaxID=1720 RepID=UPI0026DAE190|nr:type II secretion system F family protein [Corynebacterium sp.]MDO5031873.1 type II secretion system F family protein [Corynebacterium sp.]
MMAALLCAAALVLPDAAPRARLRGAEGPAKRRALLRVKTPRDGPRPQLGPLDAACDLELFAACLDAGMSAQAAVTAVATTSPAWREAAALLGVGVPMDSAWASLRAEPHLAGMVRLAQMSGDSGAAMVSGCHRLVAQLRAEAAAQATASAERAGVFIAAPLAVCFLPAFIIVGLVPVIISLGQQLL